MTVFVAGASTGATGKQLAARLAAGEADRVRLGGLRGASNAKAERALGWGPGPPSWWRGW